MKIKGLVIFTAILISLAGLGKDKDRPDQAPPPSEPIQQPADPQALGDKMDAMKAEADKVIAGARAGSLPELDFAQGALEIHCAMRPEFGPANAWLFNERDGKVRELAAKLKIAPERAETLIDSSWCESFCRDLEAASAAAGEADFIVEKTPANRLGLLWSPAPGFALQVIDRSRTVEYRPPYAGTSAGPDVAPVQMNPCLTVFAYPPLPGKSARSLMTRHQPGEPFFFTGSLVAFTLQEPQSQDVSPDLIREPLLKILQDRGLIHEVPPDAAAQVEKAAGQKPEEVRSLNGLIVVRDDSPAPQLKPSALTGHAVIWITAQGPEETIELLIAP